MAKYIGQMELLSTSEGSLLFNQGLKLMFSLLEDGQTLVWADWVKF